MSFFSDIKEFVFREYGRTKLGGAITTLSDADEYPVAFANEIAGGFHSVGSLEELKQISLFRMQPGMNCVVNQHVSPTGELVRKTRYSLETKPEQKLSALEEQGIAVDVSAYWKIEEIAANFEGALQTQYSSNVDARTGLVDSEGTTPPFPASRSNVQVTQAEYDSLVEGASVPIASLDRSLPGYWSDVFDSTRNHVWQRQRYASGTVTSPWSIPLRVAGESYAQGDYIQNLFKRSTTLPDTPAQFVNGSSNNSPVGWEDIPPANPTPAQALWMTKAQKDVFGQLKSAWTPPIEIVNNPLLVRYSERASPNPNSVPYEGLTEAGWQEAFDPARHKYLATRLDSGQGVYTSWVVTKIAEESGEFQDTIYRLFTLSQVDEVLDFPDTYRPVGIHPADWSDTPLVEAVTERLFISTCRKFFNEEQITDWSDPVPFSGQDAFQDAITSSAGDDFKKDRDGNITPSQLVLTARLYRGVTLLTPDTILWEKIYDGGDLIQPALELGATESITLLPENVLGKAIFRCTQTYQGLTFVSQKSILDIADGLDAKHIQLTANAQIITRNTNGSRLPASVTLQAFSSNLSDEGALTWKKNGVVVRNGQGNPYTSAQDSLAVNYADFNSRAEITYEVISTDGLSDTFTIYQVENSVGASGAPAVLAILSNENHTVVQDEGTGALDLDGAFTTIRIMEGAADVTAQYTISKQDSNLTSSANGVALANGVPFEVGTRILVTAMPLTASSGHVTFTATKVGAASLSKQFSITKIVDPVGSIQLDIDSDSDGFVFSPASATSKQLSASLYVNGVSRSGITAYQWFVDGAASAVTTEELTVLASQVNFQLTVRCVATYLGVNYSRTVTLTDVKDARGMGILYTIQEVDSQGNPLSLNDVPPATFAWNVASVPASATGGVAWTNVPSAGVYWQTTRTQDAAGWSAPIRIKGERGEQGETGHFMQNIFRWSATQPATPTGNPVPSGWSDAPPTVPLPRNGAQLWISYGEIRTASQGVAAQLVGTWTVPVSTSGTPGADGATSQVPGPRGADGDPVLSTGFNTHSLVSGNLASNPGILPQQGLYYSSWIAIANQMPVDRHVVIRYAVRGYNSGTQDSLLRAYPEMSTSETPSPILLDYDPGLGWEEVVEFQKTINNTWAVGQALSGVSVNRVRANTTLYVRIRLTNEGGGILRLNNLLLNAFLL